MKTVAGIHGCLAQQRRTPTIVSINLDSTLLIRKENVKSFDCWRSVAPRRQWRSRLFLATQPYCQPAVIDLLLAQLCLSWGPFLSYCEQSLASEPQCITWYSGKKKFWPSYKIGFTQNSNDVSACSTYGTGVVFERYKRSNKMQTIILQSKSLRRSEHGRNSNHFIIMYTHAYIRGLKVIVFMPMVRYSKIW